MPSILFINRVYPPSSGATGDLLAALAENLARRGYRVTVLSADAGESPHSVPSPDVRVVRTGRKLARKSFIARAVSYALMFPSLFFRALCLPAADYIVTLTDPPMLATLGSIVSFFKGSKAIHWAQDIYPELAEELGAIPRGPVANALRTVSTWALRRQDWVVSIGRCMSERLLLTRGIAASKISLIPNWTEPRRIRPLEASSNGFRRSLMLEGNFLVGYSGNIGLAHEFHAVLAAAKILKDESIVFLFIGGGPRQKEVEYEASTLGLRNVRFLASQPRESLSESLSAPDVHLVTMREDLSGLVVPSKFYGVMAAGRPCIFIGPSTSEVARIIQEHQVGMTISPTDPDSLAAAILGYRGAFDRWAQECTRARSVGEAANVEIAAAKFIEMLQMV